MIDPNKKYVTRDGRDVRIYTTDARREWPVHGAINNPDERTPDSWTPDGWLIRDTDPLDSDIIEVKPEVTVRKYLGLSFHGNLNVWASKAAAQEDPVYFGAIDITHNGDKIVKVEVVDE